MRGQSSLEPLEEAWTVIECAFGRDAWLVIVMLYKAWGVAVMPAEACVSVAVPHQKSCESQSDAHSHTLSDVLVRCTRREGNLLHQPAGLFYQSHRITMRITTKRSERARDALAVIWPGGVIIPAVVGWWTRETLPLPQGSFAIIEYEPG